MDKTPDEYHISFFKPTTPQAKANRNMVVWLVLIWFFAIFGFQFLLWIIEKPTPEPAYATFQEVWPNVESNSASTDELQKFGQVTLSVLGKLALSQDDRTSLDNALTWTIHELTSATDRSALLTKIREFEKMKAEITALSDVDYVKLKTELAQQLSPVLQISKSDVRSKILPLELVSADMSSMTDKTRESMPVIMKKYLVHNQSFLTDFKFLGFPFHYFYTAIFLLILFVGLCWLYCVKTDRLNAKMDIID